MTKRIKLWVEVELPENAPEGLEGGLQFTINDCLNADGCKVNDYGKEELQTIECVPGENIGWKNIQ